MKQALRDFPGLRHAGPEARTAAADAGRVLVPSPKWVRSVASQPVLASMRRDGWSNRRRVVELIAGRARGDGTVVATRDWLVQATGLSESTVKASIRWLREAGLLTVVVRGSTPTFRPANWLRSPETRDRNDAQVYALTRPAADPAERVKMRFAALLLTSVDETHPPALSVVVKTSQERARDSAAPSPVDNLAWPLHDTVRRKSQRRAAATRLRAEESRLAGLRVGEILALVRPFLEAGWTVADLLHALDWCPDGTAHAQSSIVRSPGGWLHWRLSHWKGPHGPLTPWSVRQAVERHKRRVETARTLHGIRYK